MPEAPNAIARGPQRLEEDWVRTRALAEERQVTLSECTLRGARRQYLTAGALVPKDGAGGDTSGAHTNWATTAASPEQLAERAPEKRGKSGSTGEKGATRPSVTATPTLWDLLLPHASPDRGSYKARTGKAFW